MAYRPDDLRNVLASHGHVHVILDSGQEYGLSRGDVDVSSGMVTIDSKRGHWSFSVKKVEQVEKEPSGPVADGS